MDQKDNHLVCFIKTMVFVMACMLAFSDDEGRTADVAMLQNDILKTEVRQTMNRTIMVPEVCSLPLVYTGLVSEYHISYRLSDTVDAVAPLIRRRLIYLAKIRETIAPASMLRYLKEIPSNKDDLPDIS